MTETERPAHYWRSMYEDQLRRKRLLHDRYDALHRAAREVAEAYRQPVGDPPCRVSVAIDRLRAALDKETGTDDARPAA